MTTEFWHVFSHREDMKSDFDTRMPLSLQLTSFICIVSSFRWSSEIRKKLYRKFGSMLNSRGAWRHPLYVRKKTTTMCREHVSETAVHVLTEIMPECVLNLVRGLYPHTPYLEHKW